MTGERRKKKVGTLWGETEHERASPWIIKLSCVSCQSWPVDLNLSTHCQKYLTRGHLQRLGRIMLPFIYSFIYVFYEYLRHFRYHFHRIFLLTVGCTKLSCEIIEPLNNKAIYKMAIKSFLPCQTLEYIFGVVAIPFLINLNLRPMFHEHSCQVLQDTRWHQLRY